jgi:hypothetical protein
MMEDTESPAAIEVRQEVGKIMFDPTHKLHAGFVRNDKAVDEHINELYRRAYGTEGGQMPGLTVGGEGALFDSSRGRAPTAPDLPPLVSRDGLSFTSDISGIERAEHARTEALATLQQQFGDDFASTLIPEDPTAIQADLQREWGSEFAARWAGVTNLGTQLMQRAPQLYMESSFLLGDARGIRLLDAIRQMLATYKP